MYHADLGRFLTRDLPMVASPEDPRMLMAYAYAANAPTLYTDPSGAFFTINGMLSAIRTGMRIAASYTYVAYQAAMGALTRVSFSKTS